MAGEEDINEESTQNEGLQPHHEDANGTESFGENQQPIDGLADAAETSSTPTNPVLSHPFSPNNEEALRPTPDSVHEVAGCHKSPAHVDYEEFIDESRTARDFETELRAMRASDSFNRRAAWPRENLLIDLSKKRDRPHPRRRRSNIRHRTFDQESTSSEEPVRRRGNQEISQIKSGRGMPSYRRRSSSFSHHSESRENSEDQDERRPSLPSLLETEELKVWQHRLLGVAKMDVFHTTVRKDQDKPKRCIVNIAALQRVAIIRSRIKLARAAKDILIDDPSSSDERPLEKRVSDVLMKEIHDYCEAIRDYDYMREYAARHFDDDMDPFLISSSRTFDRNIMEAVGLIPDHVLPKGNLEEARDARDPKLVLDDRHKFIRDDDKKQFLLRLSMAVAGGLFLIIPMLIMIFVRSRAVFVATTCIAILVAALALAFRSELRPNEIIGTCAAYAAVLVVFIGSSLPAV